MQNGRYTRPLADPMDAVFPVRITSAEKARWQAMAQDRGVPFAGAIRRGVREFFDGPPSSTCPTCDAPHGLLPGAADLDSAFGHWLAGFVDGEGHFAIVKNNGGRSVCCRFTLKLRDDDEAILQEAVGRTGAGFVTYELPGRRRPHRAAKWYVAEKEGCLRLVSVFDAYPLRAKKARDFAIWREAVFEWCRVGGVRSGHAGPASWGRMRELREQLMTGRAYQ